MKKIIGHGFNSISNAHKWGYQTRFNSPYLGKQFASQYRELLVFIDNLEVVLMSENFFLIKRIGSIH